jgi:hypothetical protein
MCGTFSLTPDKVSGIQSGKAQDKNNKKDNSEQFRHFYFLILVI